MKLIWLIVTTFVVGIVSGKDQVLRLDARTCPYKIYELDEEKKIQVKWDGRKLPDVCELSFHGSSDSNVLNRYKVCVETRNFYIDSCDFTMKYYNGFGLQATKEYNCNTRSLPPKFCANESTYFEIHFATGPTSSSSVTLEVSAILTYEENNIPLYVGLSIGGVSCIVIVFVALYILCRMRSQKKKKNQRPTTQHPMNHMTALQNHQATPTAPPFNPNQYGQSGQGIYPGHAIMPTYSGSFTGGPNHHPPM